MHKRKETNTVGKLCTTFKQLCTYPRQWYLSINLRVEKSNQRTSKNDIDSWSCNMVKRRHVTGMTVLQTKMFPNIFWTHVSKKVHLFVPLITMALLNENKTIWYIFLKRRISNFFFIWLYLVINWVFLHSVFLNRLYEF